MYIKSGKIKYPADRKFPDKYNEGRFKQNLKVQLDDGSEETLWFASGRQPHASLQTGNPVQILYEQKQGKTQRRLIVPDQATESGTIPAQAETQHRFKPEADWQQWTNEEKHAIASKVDAHADLLAYCLRQAREKFLPYCESSEDLRALATTLYLSALKR